MKRTPKDTMVLIFDNSIPVLTSVKFPPKEPQDGWTARWTPSFLSGGERITEVSHSVGTNCKNVGNIR